VSRSPGVALFPSAPVLLSHATLYVLEHPAGALTLGLLGSAPFALLLVLFLREAHEATLLAPGSVAGLFGPALALGALWLWRFPCRLALAHWMAQQRHGRSPSLARALLFGLAQWPAGLQYGSLSTLGFITGLALIVPLALTLQGSLALHLFAAGQGSSRQAWDEAGRVPATGVGWRVLLVSQVLFLLSALVLWTGPGSALGLAEWLLRLDVSAWNELFAPTSAAWLLTVLALAWMLVELLWSVAYGLVAEEWERISGGADLSRRLAQLEARDEVFA